MNLSLDPDGQTVRVTLSRRNLTALLTKLNGVPANSACTISMTTLFEGYEDIGEITLVVKAEEDEAHYKGREPGRMHPDTERILGRRET